MRPRTRFLPCCSCLLLVPAWCQAVELGTIDIHGFLSQGWFITEGNNWLAPESTDGSFEFNEAAINIGTDLTDDLRLGLQILARDLGRYGNNEAVIDWAYADWSPRREIGLRVGRIKTPLGLYNEILDIDAARTAVLLPGTIYSADFRDILLANNGFQIYGNIPLGTGGGDLDYQIYAGAISMTKDSAVADLFTGNGLLTQVESIDTDGTWGGRLIWNTPLDGLRGAASLGVLDDLRVTGNGIIGFDPATGPTYGPMTLHMDELVQVVASLEYAWSDLVLSAEYLRRQLTVRVVGTELDLDQEGWYGSLTWRLDPSWEIGTYYGEYYADRDQRTDDGPAAYQRDLALTLRHDINQNWLAKLEYHWLQGTGYLNGTLNPDGTDDTWSAFFLKTTLIF